MKHLISSALLSLGLLGAASAAPTTINFDTEPTDTTYLSSGLLLGSSGGYIIGGCGAGSVGCLGDAATPFSGVLTFTFVTPDTTDQSSTDMVSFIMCRGCNGRPTVANVFDFNGALLTSIDMNVTSSDVADHTFSYAAANIGWVSIDLGFDAVESITFGDIEPGNRTPEPGALALAALALGGLALGQRRRPR